MRRAALLALLALAACRTPRGTQEAPLVTALVLRGVGAVDASALAARLATQGPSCTLGLACQYTALDEDALAADRRRVAAFYRERGYDRAAVDEVAIEPQGEGRVRVTLRVSEGPPLRVDRVIVEGLDEAPEARAGAGRLAIAEGQVFTEEAFDRARGQLQAALLATGWPTGTVAQEAVVSPEEGKVEVRYRVVTGPRYRFGHVFVAGTSAVPREKVVARTEREVHPGDWYDETRLDRAQARVFDLGVFSGVRVSRGAPDPERGTVPVVAAVREAPFRTLRLGPGLGFQTNRWEVLGIGSWTHRNWLGGLRRLQLDARAGYAWLPSPVRPRREGLVGTLAADLSQPGILRDVVDLSLRTEVERGLEEGYRSTSEKIRLGFPFRPAPRWTIVPSYNVELYQLSDLAGGATSTPVLMQNCPARSCLLSFLEQRVTWDGRNDPLQTTRGFYGSFALQEGFPIGGAGYTYLRLLPEVRAYAPLAPGRTLALRARLGALVPLHEAGPAPVVALFTSGGPTSMRGYSSGRFGPMAFQDGAWIPTGGNGLVEGMLELREDLGRDLGAVLFLDAGNVSAASGVPSAWRSVLDPSLLQAALGLGLRYRTPFGPLRLDLAARVPTDWRRGVSFGQRFPPVPGGSGHREPIAALHLSLGEAF